MTDSLIVARALLRLGPWARPARHDRSETNVRERDERVAQRSGSQSRDPWHTGAARAAFTIWATEASRPARSRR
jgi:hypothetical protein